MTSWLRPLGQTQIKVSAIGLGTVKLGRDRDVKYPGAFAIPDLPAARRLLDCARDCGINLLDTAPAYGESEQRLGELLRGQRQHWVVCSKVGEQWCGAGSRFDFSPQAIRRSVEASLQRLGCDELDLVLVHSDGNDLDIINNLGTLQALRDLQQRGLLRAVGFSPKTIAGGFAAAQDCDVLMVSYSAQDPSHEVVLERCGELGRGVLLKKVLASGALARGGPTDTRLRQSLALALRHPATNCAVIGTINSHHLRNNVDIAKELLGQP